MVPVVVELKSSNWIIDWITSAAQAMASPYPIGAYQEERAAIDLTQYSI